MSVTNLVTSHRNGFAHSSNQEVVQALVTEVKAHYPTTSTRMIKGRLELHEAHVPRANISASVK